MRANLKQVLLSRSLKRNKGKSMEKKKIGLSIFDPQRIFGWEKTFEICRDAGFDAIDFNLEAYFLGDEIYGGSEDAFVSHFTKIKEKADELGLEISQTHGRCWCWDPVDTSINERHYKICEKDLYATKILGGMPCVIHSLNTTRWGKQPPEVMREKNSEMFNSILPFAEKYQVKIAFETFGRATCAPGERTSEFFAYPEEMLRQYNDFNTEYKTICLDSGHTHEAGNFWVPPVEDMIRILGKDITLTHLHDNTGVRDDHLLPTMGNIKWERVFDAFDEIGYNGVYNFELRTAFFGGMQEEALKFYGKYLRKFVDGHGVVR